MSKCKEKPFVSAEDNTKSALKTRKIIDEYSTILNDKVFNSMKTQLLNHGKDTYGIVADWIQNINGKVIANKEAFQAVDFINGQVIKDPLDNIYLQQIKIARKLNDGLDEALRKDARRRLEELDDNGGVLYDPSFNIYNDININSVPRGGLAQLVHLKQTLLRNAKNKLSRLVAASKQQKSNQGEYIRLIKEANKLREYISGDTNKGTIGLEKEIADIAKIDSRSPELIEPYIRKELDRLAYLIESNDAKDNNEAKDIIQFITTMGDFSNPSKIKSEGHPVYDADELFDDQGNFLLQDIMADPFKQWRAEAEEFQQKLDAKRVKLFEETFNTVPQVAKMYGKKFTLKELTEHGLKDIHWIDMMVMSIDAGILGHSGLIPQTIKIIVNQEFEKHESWSKKIVERIDELLPNVEKKLRELGYGVGIPGLRGVTYSLFRQEYKDGNKTRELAYKYSPEYQDDKNRVLSLFWKMMKAADTLQGYNKVQTITKAYKNRNSWINKNTVFINPAMIEELKNNPEFDEFKSLFSNDVTQIQAHVYKIREQVGDIHYQQIIDTQIKLLSEYKTQRNIKMAELLVNDNVSSINDLTEASKTQLAIWEAQYSPFIAATYMESGQPTVIGNLTVNSKDLRFNSFIPLKEIDGENSGYYDTKYDIIENEPILKEFYDVIYEATSGMMERFDHEQQQKMTATTIPFQEKNFMDLFIDEDIPFHKAVSTAFIRMLDNIKNSFGVKKQGTMSQEMISSINRLPEDKINDSFISKNVDKIDNLFKIRVSTFMAKYNAGRPKLRFNMTKDEMTNAQLNKLTKSTVVLLNSQNRGDLNTLLSPYLRDNESILLGKEGDEIPVGKILYNATQDEVVSEHSFDLPKIIKVYANATAQYAARKEMLPLVQIMKQYYEGIKKQDTTNDNNPIYNTTIDRTHVNGNRVNAIKQFENWYQRVVLGNYGLRNQYGIKDTKLYTEDERKQIIELDEAIELEKDVKKKLELQEMRERLGVNFAGSGVIDSFLNIVRFTGLAWNLSSGITNLLSGQIDNTINATSGIYFSNPSYIDTVTPLEMILGNSVSLASKKNTPQKIAKAKLIMDRYDLLKDASNELQKASAKGAFSNLSRFNPYYALKKGEDYNQTPLNIAILRDSSIKDINGNVSNVWDALEAIWDTTYKQWDLRLKNEFRTEENIANWEEGNGQDYFAFKERTTSVVTDTHGDFDPRSGMMAKSYQLGQMALMFKTWYSRQFFTRFAVEQDRLNIGVKGFKGRYLSHTPVSATVHGGIIGILSFGPIGGLVGAGIGAVAGKFTNTKSGLSILQELYHVNRILLRKLMGFPINGISRLVANKNVIDEDWQKLFKQMESKSFTDKDFQRYKANTQEMAVTLALIGLLLLTKAVAWNDDDEKDSTRRYWHNIFANRFISLSGQITSYLNPIETFKTVTSIGFFRLLANISKLILDFGKFIEGEDTIPTGVHAGESAIANQFKKTFIPGILKDPLSFGFGSQGENQFMKTPFDKYFWGDEKVSQKELRGDKAEKKNQIDEQLEEGEIDDKQYEKEIKKLNKQFRKNKSQTYQRKLEEHKRKQQVEQE